MGTERTSPPTSFCGGVTAWRDNPAGAEGGRIRIGTSGWHYASWLGPFYPERLRKAAMLPFYAGRFDTSEINLSFYRLPSEETVAAWREGTPPGFVFAWKAHRVITHYRRLRNAEENLAFVFGRMAGLGDKAGPVLFQLPPKLAPDPGRLAAFLDLLPAGGRHVFEFRHPGWYAPEVFDLLARHGAALCLSDHADAPAPWLRTADFVYVRGHGPSGRYHGRYPDETLADGAARMEAWREAGHDVFCYLDNDVKAAAPADAATLAGLLSR